MFLRYKTYRSASAAPKKQTAAASSQSPLRLFPPTAKMHCASLLLFSPPNPLALGFGGDPVLCFLRDFDLALQKYVLKDAKEKKKTTRAGGFLEMHRK